MKRFWLAFAGMSVLFFGSAEAANLVLECKAELTDGTKVFRFKRRYEINIEAMRYSTFDNFGAGWERRSDNDYLDYADSSRIQLVDNEYAIHYLDRKTGSMYSKERDTGKIRRGFCEKAEPLKNKF
ncbi:hypothetical protein I6F26_03725 [Ensifer sp. IC3342]|nr:hypothetical protein [Ensifer sp. BRP08]MCA1445700.1 hypothetical protein [Ensifer sp. IC3342]